MGISFSSLTAATVEELVGAAKADPADDNPAMNEIVRRFQRRAMCLATALTRQARLHDDLAQAALIGLVRAVRRHDPTKQGFPSYARRYMLGAARRELKAWIGETTESLSEPTVWSAASSVAAHAPTPGIFCWGHGAVARAVGDLPDRQRDLLFRRYVHDAGLAEIALDAGSTVSAISQRLMTAHRAVAIRLAA